MFPNSQKSWGNRACTNSVYQALFSPPSHRNKAVIVLTFVAKKLRHCHVYYHSLSKICPWAMMNLRSSSKRGMGILSRVVIFRPIYVHMQTSINSMYTCGASVVPLLSCICLCNNSKWCLPSFVSPSSCSALLFWCFLHGSMA